MNLRAAALLFDMDGTLVDSTSVVEEAWRRWAAKYGVPLPEILRFSHGRPAFPTMERFRPGGDHQADIAELNRYEQTQLAGIKEIPGAAALLKTVAAGPWAIVTSAHRKLAVARVEAAGLPVPKVMVPFDEITHGKPHPEGYLRAATLLGAAPSDCLVFEDTRPGIEAGLAAGMRVVGLTTTHPDMDHTPKIRDYRDLTVTRDGAGFEVRIG